MTTNDPNAVRHSPAVTLIATYRRFQWLAVIVPTALATVAVALQCWWLGELPDPAATHFSGSGPDGFGPAWTYPVLTAAIALTLVAVTGFSGWRAVRSGTWGATLRFLGAFCPGVVLMLLVGLTWTVHSQRGLADAAQASDPGWFVLVGAGIGAVYGVAAWFIQLDLRLQPDGREAQARVLGSGEKVVWMQATTLSPVARIVLGIALLMVLGLAIAVTLWDDTVLAAVILWGTLVLVAVLTLATSRFRVRIDESGLRVRSALGLPRWHIPLAEITAARSVPVNPLADFGGWGVRWQPGNGVGIVTRRGEALQVEYRSGKRLTVTVDDSARASDVLASLLQRVA